MSALFDTGDRELTAPFLVKLFCRNGTFYRPEEFASPSLPSYTPVYTWPDCSLTELALELAASKPSVLPSPSIGTRLAFQLVCPDLRGTSATSTAHPRFIVKDLGSIVIGDGGPGINDSDDGSVDQPMSDEDAGHKTLADSRFVVGDYISCAVLPPLSDGSVAPASSARRHSISAREREPRATFRGGIGARENSFGRGNGHAVRGGRWNAGGGGGGGGGGGFPEGEWRRGEKLPGESPGRQRGRARR